MLSFGEKGRTVPPVVAFVRGKEPEFREIHESEKASATADSGAIYYVLRVDQIITTIDERLKKWKKGEL